jgi:hypothetical protein
MKHKLSGQIWRFVPYQLPPTLTNPSYDLFSVKIDYDNVEVLTGATTTGQTNVHLIEGEYWLKVYEDSNKLYQLFKSRTDTGGIQVWTAEMWATLWVAYQFGKRVKNHKELDFIMGTNNIADVEKVKIYHNAGVTDKIKETHFFKGEYTNKYPLTFRNTLRKNNASWWYVEQIKKYV